MRHAVEEGIKIVAAATVHEVIEVDVCKGWSWMEDTGGGRWERDIGSSGHHGYLLSPKDKHCLWWGDTGADPGTSGLLTLVHAHPPITV